MTKKEKLKQAIKFFTEQKRNMPEPTFDEDFDLAIECMEKELSKYQGCGDWAKKYYDDYAGVVKDLETEERYG